MLLDSRLVPADSAADVTARGDAPAPALPWASDLAVPLDQELWVFAYGSLMWNPGFPFVERELAILKGWHRRFCLSSHRYRGTPERPGLVLGLDRGGMCRGVAFRVAPAHTAETMHYLWDREMNTRAYRPRLLRVRMAGGRSVAACAFTVDRSHAHYCGCLEPALVAERIVACAGERGSNLEYLANTVAHLDEMGIRDRGLSELLALVRRRMEGGA